MEFESNHVNSRSSQYTVHTYLWFLAVILTFTSQNVYISYYLLITYPRELLQKTNVHFSGHNQKALSENN